MPSYDFSFVPKVQGKRKTTKSGDRIEVVLTGVTGVIWIDKNAKYTVACEDGFVYDIHPESYSCKGKSTVYRHGEGDKVRVRHIRVFGEYNDCKRDNWLPFGIGCVVKGDLVCNNYTNQKYFIIKKCSVDYNNLDSHSALDFYRQHIEEITNVIKSKRREIT